jgi:hypothetical protein
MKAIVFLGAILFLGPLCRAQMPIPPGVRQADEAEAKADRDIPPPVAGQRTVNLAKLRQDADELATLASSIPNEVNETTKGELPKDLPGKLKKIEKLAKRLRSQLTR